MPAATIPGSRRRPTSSPSRGGGGSLMEKRILGVRAPVLLGGLGIAVLLGLWWRNRSASSSATQPSAASSPADTTTGTTGGAGSSGDTSAGTSAAQDLTPFEDLAAALNGLTAQLGAGVATIPQDATGTPPDQVPPVGGAPTWTWSSVGSALAWETGHGAAAGLGTTQSQPAARPKQITGQGKTGLVTTGKVQPGYAAPVNHASIVQPKAGVISQKTTKSGAVIRTYKSGVVTEQAKGGSEYRVSKKANAPAKKPAPQPYKGRH